MIIKSVRVQNFRCILDATLDCEPLTALVGPNGCGKSSFLRAIQLFYAPNPKFDPEDFYNGHTDHDIEISITFTDLDEAAKRKFAPYLEGEDLTVTRVLSLSGERASARFYGSRLQNADFIAIRNAGGAVPARQQYAELRKSPQYSDLPTATSQAAVLDALKAWEEAHPEQCSRRRDDGQFFGFTEVAQGYLGRFTHFIPIAAVRDAAEDAAEGRGSPITEIMDLVVRSTLANREELKTLKEETQRRYDEIVKPDEPTELDQLENTLTGTLKTYAPDASVQLEWSLAGGIEITMPRAEVKLVEDGYSATVTRTGHGLQRAFILTMLQHLAVAQAPRQGEHASEEMADLETEARSAEEPRAVIDVNLPDIILGIEEPELYQHPNRQRYLASILLRLATGAIPGVSRRTQVLYSTHSPLFVGLDRFDQVRVFRKVESGIGNPKVTQVTRVTGDSVAEEIWEANDRRDSDGRPVTQFTWQTLRPRLHSIMTPWMSEGFFADVAVLVEGEDDRAAIVGTARAMGHDLESEGVSVIPCGGKCSLDRPLVIFRRFGLRTYVVWDGDQGGKDASPKENHRLLRLVGKPVEDWPSTQVDAHFACFQRGLEHTVRGDIGDEHFDQLVSECQDNCGITKRKDAMKNPVVIEQLVQTAESRGLSCAALRDIVGRILELRRSTLSGETTTVESGNP